MTNPVNTRAPRYYTKEQVETVIKLCKLELSTSDILLEVPEFNAADVMIFKAMYGPRKNGVRNAIMRHYTEQKEDWLHRAYLEACVCRSYFNRCVKALTGGYMENSKENRINFRKVEDIDTESLKKKISEILEKSPKTKDRHISEELGVTIKYVMSIRKELGLLRKVKRK